AMAAMSLMFGPLVMVPLLALANTVAFVSSTDRRRRWLVISLGCMAVLLPFALTMCGILPQPYHFPAGVWTISPLAFELRGLPTLVFLAVGSVAAIALAGLFIGHYRDSVMDAERQLYLHSWQLRQIVPNEDV